MGRLDVKGSDLQVHHDTRGGEWAALYVSGKLEFVGDRENVYELALEKLGVISVHDNAFMRGGFIQEDVAQTLGEVHTYRTKRDAAREEARKLRAEAERLTNRAAELENSNR